MKAPMREEERKKNEKQKKRKQRASESETSSRGDQWVEEIGVEWNEQEERGRGRKDRVYRMTSERWPVEAT